MIYKSNIHDRTKKGVVSKYITCHSEARKCPKNLKVFAVTHKLT